MENILLISDQQVGHILSWRFERDRLVSQWEIGKLVPTDILVGVFMSIMTNILLFMINLERK